MARPFRTVQPKIREWRLIRGMTQATLAERAKVRRATISDIERGANLPTVETLREVSRILRVPVDDLFKDPFEVVRAKFDGRRNQAES